MRVLILEAGTEEAQLKAFGAQDAGFLVIHKHLDHDTASNMVKDTTLDPVGEEEVGAKPFENCVPTGVSAGTDLYTMYGDRCTYFEIPS